MKKYITTKKQCKQIINNFVCPQCGGELEPIETVDNSKHPTFWSGCQTCRKYSLGVEPEIHKIAKYLVEEFNYIHYKSMDSPYNKDESYQNYYRLTQTGGACSIVYDVIRGIKKIGLKEKLL